jgi:HSP20 family molecular chaperone IbpA
MGPAFASGRAKSLLGEGLSAMSRMSLLSSPLLLGFDEIERLIDRVGKGGTEGYPPYNIERIPKSDSDAETLRITLAVAGFTRDQLDITLEDNQLTIRGKQDDDKSREYLHRGIAARQFQRTFVLADGIEVRNADLTNGLLFIDLVRHQPERLIRRIEIGRKSAG